ncbi:MAG: hypothetical protein DWP92_05100 [Armatimonadetes bacterium]|nr:MAG: hypothetical protein DWP92_05100 [Armatimonadota bacterium]
MKARTWIDLLVGGLLLLGIFYIKAYSPAWSSWFWWSLLVVGAGLVMWNIRRAVKREAQDQSED